LFQKPAIKVAEYLADCFSKNGYPFILKKFNDSQKIIEKALKKGYQINIYFLDIKNKILEKSVLKGEKNERFR